MRSPALLLLAVAGYCNGSTVLFGRYSERDMKIDYPSRTNLEGNA